MKLIDVLRQECVVSGAKFDCKTAVLNAVADAAKACAVLADVDRSVLLDALEEREALGSTGFGDAIAIPHCRLESIDDFVVGLITVPDGVDFEALDGQPVRLIVFIVAPLDASNEHIRLLSAVSQTLQTPHATKEILAGASPEAVRESFLRHTRDEVKIKDRHHRNLIHVFVQDEGVLRDIVQALEAFDSSSLVVVDTENIGAYLAKMPLFAGFWRDEPRGFGRLIILTVDRDLTNETLRRIEGITGDLDARDDLMVTVQELFYCAGALNA